MCAVLARLERMGHDPAAVRRSLRLRECNDLTTAYHLLYEGSMAPPSAAALAGAVHPAAIAPQPQHPQSRLARGVGAESPPAAAAAVAAAAAGREEGDAAASGLIKAMHSGACTANAAEAVSAMLGAMAVAAAAGALDSGSKLAAAAAKEASPLAH